MKKNNTILIFIFSFLITLALVFLFVFILNAIKNKNKHVSVVSSTLQDKIKEKEKISISKEKIIELQDINNSISNYFVNVNEIDRFVDYLENMSVFTGSQLVINGIEVSPKVENIISFKISAVGDFNEVMKTLNLLENIPYEIKVTQVYLNKKNNLLVQNNLESKEIRKAPDWQIDISFNILSIK